jgi:hypothetical protein
MANQHTPEISAPVVIEADTVEDALARLTTEVGPDARIVSAERIRKGGIAGFFAREVVELVAEPPQGSDESSDDAITEGVDSAFARLLDQAEAADPTGAGDALDDAQPDQSHGARWDAGRLIDLGIPDRIVQTVAGLDPSDDLAHVTALATALEPFCESFDQDALLLVGTDARHERLPRHYRGPVHLVVGRGPLPEKLPGIPEVISWSSVEAAPRAISLAFTTNAKLGWWQPCGSKDVRRVTPLDAAFVIRELMVRP